MVRMDRAPQGTRMSAAPPSAEESAGCRGVCGEEHRTRKRHQGTSAPAWERGTACESNHPTAGAVTGVMGNQANQVCGLRVSSGPACKRVSFRSFRCNVRWSPAVSWRCWFGQRQGAIAGVARRVPVTGAAFLQGAVRADWDCPCPGANWGVGTLT